MIESAPACRPVPGRTGQGWCLPPTVLGFGGKLMEQQVWCWGRDVEYATGNLLMQFGFERHRDSDAVDRSSCYRLDQGVFHVCLWGFGMFFGCRELGGLYLDRFDFRPAWAPVESLSLAIHWPDELPVFGRPRGRLAWQRARRLWSLALHWIADYEKWVRRHAGLAYRRRCIEAWLRPFVRADKIPAAWRFLGQRHWESVDRSLSQWLKRYTFPQRPI